MVYKYEIAKFYGNQEIEVGTRMLFQSSLLESRLFFNVSTWPSLVPKAITIMTHAYVQPLRTILDMKNDGEEVRYTNAQVLVQAQRPTLCEMLRCSRLRYLARMLGRPSAQQLRLVFSVHVLQSEWLRLIIEDADIVIKTADASWPLASLGLPEFLLCDLEQPKSVEVSG